MPMPLGNFIIGKNIVWNSLISCLRFEGTLGHALLTKLCLIFDVLATFVVKLIPNVCGQA